MDYSSKFMAKLNNNSKVYPDCTLHSVIEKQAALFPDNVALRFNNQEMTYRELNRKSNIIAQHLIKKGVKPDSIVGICVERSFEMVIGLLAILKAGGAYLPLDPDYPQNRIDFIIKDAMLEIVLSTRLLAKLVFAADEVILLDNKAAYREDNSENPIVGVNQNNLAYVIYTSGSTGQPKGVMIEHKAIVNRLFWMQDQFQLTFNDCVLQKTPYSFDVSVWEFFWPLMNGVTLVIAKPGGHKDNSYLINTIERNEITVIHFVPSMLRLFLQTDGFERLSKLRLVICSGETLPVDLEKNFYQRCNAALYNLYGPTEAAVDVSFWECSKNSNLSIVPIGYPITNIQLYILKDNLKPAKVGEDGELFIGGIGLARGYLNRPDLTKEKFIDNPFDDSGKSRLYKTGDLCRYLTDGAIEYKGRLDFQVKIRGFRIELGEIEAVIKEDSNVYDCAVIARERVPGDIRLAAYIICLSEKFTSDQMRNRLKDRLPEYMVPSIFIRMDCFPLTPSGKLDRKALPDAGRKRPDLQQEFIEPRSEIEKKIASIWCNELNLDKAGIDDNFFDLGGNSLLAIQVVNNLKKNFEIDIPVVKLFQFPTVNKLAQHIEQADIRPGIIDKINERATRHRIGRFYNDPATDGVAIIGMAGRFPGASNCEKLWENLCNGVESITFFDRNELGPGVDKEILNDPDYIPARGIIEDADKFDASFFGIGPQEAKVMDPQQRVFLELAWEVLERAGYYAEGFDGIIGVYAGVGDNHYYPLNLLGNPDLLKMVGKLIVGYGNEKDYIATRVSFALNLTGPSVSANTGCSTSLLAIDNAFRALIDYECDMALAGGVDIGIPQKSGFLYQKGGVFSRDGHCRPFDSEATGTMFNDGAGVVVLKRLSDALNDGDKIWAVIRGTAKNNDGANKVSFLAPSVDGQAQVIAMAQANANIHPEQIGYIEAHGTGTPIGDPIEIEALTKAFRQYTQKKQFCYIGSIKGNIGHPTIASGVTGLIKTALSLYHEEIPATLHYKNPNSKIDFPNSPFKVVNSLTPWLRNNNPRIAGVSSFGFGGTNVHVIIEEAPIQSKSGRSRPKQLFLFSAKTKHSLDILTVSFKDFFARNPDLNLADAAFTLQTGRKPFAYRKFIVAGSLKEASNHLEHTNPVYTNNAFCQSRNPEIVFMFPGQGSQYINMGKNLYESEPLFSKCIDTCCEYLEPELGCNLKDIIFPVHDNEQHAYNSLKNTRYTQPAIFMIEYALAALWKSWGIKPAAMIGHSIGEFAAACIADVFSLKDACKLIALRGSLMQNLPEGSMLSVRAAAEYIEKRLPSDVQLAATNSPVLCVLSGPDEVVNSFQKVLEDDGILCKYLHTSHAFHSAMMDSVVHPFTEAVNNIKLAPPKTPLLSTITTEWMTQAQATDPSYWGMHLRLPVRFSKGIQKIINEKKYAVLLETGPRNTLSTLARQNMTGNNRLPVVSSLSDTHENCMEWIALLSAAGNLWLNGAELDWRSFYRNEKRHRIPLPTYPFERKRYWVDPIPRVYDNSNKAFICNETSDTLQEKVSEEINQQIPDNELIIKRLTTILEEISGISLANMPHETTFIEMGMDSLLLSQIAFRIKSEFRLKVTFGQLIQNYPNRAILAEYIKEAIVKDNTDSETSITTEEVKCLSANRQSEKKIPVTEAQEELWLSCQINPDASCAYNESLTISFKEPFDRNAIKTAIKEAANRHEALHSVFTKDGKHIIILPDLEPDICSHDLRSMQFNEADRVVSEIEYKESIIPFDLESGPLIRTHIIAIPENQWRVIITAHHIICDGWSIDVLLNDIATCYSKITLRKTADLPEPYQFSKYAQALSDRKSSDEYAECEQYWTEKFSPLPETLNLPLDNTRPLIRTYNAKRVDLMINPEIYEKVIKLSSDMNSSIFNILLSTFYMLLYRLCGQNDLIAGIPAAGQASVNQKNLTGHCVNLLPLRLKVDDTWNVTDFIKAVQSELLASYDNLYTYGSLLKKLRIKRDPSRMPLLSVGFTSSSEYKNGSLLFGNSDFSYKLNPRSFETFEWYMNVREANGKLLVLCHYNSDLFLPQTMELRLKEYERLLKSICEYTAKPVQNIPILPESEKKLILKDWNGTFVEYDQNLCLHQLFEQMVQTNPQRIAIITKTQSISYLKLNERANELAICLKRLGVGPGFVTGILLNRSINMVVALLGVLKSGSAYLPLDPTFPKQRIKYMLEDSSVTVVIANEFTRHLLSEYKQVIIDIDSNLSNIGMNTKKRSEENRSVSECKSENIAYIIYTSGSTGNPKGVKIPHRAVVNFIMSMSKRPGITEEDCVLSVTTISFDISVLELFLPLSTGARVTIIPYEHIIDGGLLLNAIEKFGVTFMQATPSTWRLLIGAGWNRDKRIKALCGGEAMPPDLMPQLLERASSVWNMYGPTETTVWSTCHQFLHAKESISIGKPIANTQVYILDRFFNPVPVGVWGELFIGGDGLSTGYHNLPELTREKFVISPFGQSPQEYIYRTGDRCRFRTNGFIEYASRMDDQVKVRGHRIELGEIETVLRAFKGIKDAAVAIKGDGEQMRIVAYLVLENMEMPTNKTLRSFVNQKLPQYMLPSQFIELENIPLTPNGKVDRKSLPEPGTSRPDLDKNFVSPSTAYEKMLTDIWKEVLNIDKIGIQDNFFDIGGNSMLIANVNLMISEKMKKNIPLIKLFQYPTIEALSRFLNPDTEDGQEKDSARKRSNSKKKALARKRNAAMKRIEDV